MQEPLDYDLPTNADGPSIRAQPSRPGRIWILATLLILGAVLAALFRFGGSGRRPAPVAGPPQAVKETTEAVRPLGRDPMSVSVPALEASDPFVRELVRHLSSHPRIAAWLATDGLIRNFTVVVTNIAEGSAPARHLAVLRPSSGFRVVERDDALYVNSQSYERYTSLADAAASISPSGIAQVYATLKPRIEEAYRELGLPEASFDRTLERAVVLLLQTPLPDSPMEVEPRGGIAYGFADERLEGLTPTQKQLLRMGPRNMRVIQGSLRDIALALGIPADRLPARKSP